MDEIEKLFRKISTKERLALQLLIEDLLNKKGNLDIKKLKNSDFYRLRNRRFRIIFHYNRKEIIIDSIRIRRENIYKDC